MSGSAQRGSAATPVESRALETRAEEPVRLGVLGDYIGFHLRLSQAASFRVNSDPAGSQVYGRVDADGLGRFVVAWTSYGGGPTGTFGTRIASGAAGPEFQIATATQLSTLTSAAAPSATACSSAAPPAPALGTT